jgi:hypothetical protein
MKEIEWWLERKAASNTAQLRKNHVTHALYMIAGGLFQLLSFLSHFEVHHPTLYSNSAML